MNRLLKTTLVPLALPLLLSGCLSNAGSDLDASSSTQSARSKRDVDEDTGKRRVCEHTEIGGEPKSFCY